MQVLPVSSELIKLMIQLLWTSLNYLYIHDFVIVARVVRVLEHVSDQDQLGQDTQDTLYYYCKQHQ